MSGPPPVPGRRERPPSARTERDRAAARDARSAVRGPSPRTREPRTRLNRRGRLVLLVLALLAVAAAWFLASLFQPFHGDGSGKVGVVIPRESGVGDIAKLLERKGVVSSGFFFEARATIGGRRGDLKPGTYTLKRDMSYSAAIDLLAKGPPPNLVTLLVPEGKSRREIAVSIKSLTGDYMAATRRSPLLDPADYGAENARDLEGFLFPASYQLKRGQSVDALVEKQLQAFEERFAEVDLRAAKKANLTPYDVLIIASLVEREAADPSERPVVASVIYNRLRDGMTLGLDATTRFQFNNWRKPLTQSELASPSPYNTRLNRGLPPGPIGSPGIESIEAAANPDETDYLYYVADCDNPGSHVFSRTQAEHDAAAARYDAAREKAGGNAPKQC